MFSQKLVVDSAVNAEKTIDVPLNVTYNSNYYQDQLNIEAIRQCSLSEAIYLASQVNMKHNAKGCDQCDMVAQYYITALRFARDSEPIQCNENLYDLIWRMTNLVLAHRETNTYQHLNWFNSVTSELWEFAKQLKDESWECDSFVQVGGIKQTSTDSLFTYEDESISEEDHYRRAMRITIYNCRALVCEQNNDSNQAIIYYKKCASVRPTPFEPQQHLQQSALTALKNLISSSRQTIVSLRSSSSNTISTVNSASTSTSRSASICISCSNCGKEKENMPVCSRCRSTPYCSVRCMKTHKSEHSLTCGFK
ncbi:hypothetical protein K501DRAFT_288431 [Backusella circina FSU 941]|nr:hypothetical protein K501DRAFT_288431 [Backusella circina FSU 941]